MTQEAAATRLHALTSRDTKAAQKTPFLVRSLPAWFCSAMLKDQRDIPMLCYTLEIALVLGTTFTTTLLSTPGSWLRTVATLAHICVAMPLYMERFILLMHFAEHRPIFVFKPLNMIYEMVMAPLFGIPLGAYRLHHVHMHHVR